MIFIVLATFLLLVLGVVIWALLAVLCLLLLAVLCLLLLRASSRVMYWFADRPTLGKRHQLECTREGLVVNGTLARVD
jgi:hypothetical protein